MQAEDSGVARQDVGTCAAASRIARFRQLQSCVLVVVLGACRVDVAAQTAADDPNLPNVIVTDRRLETSDQVRGSKIDLPAIDVPLSAERLDPATVERTGLQGLGPLLQATTSVTAQSADGNAFNDFLLRGFSNTPVYRNGINDSVGDRPARTLANVEMIEVLKGPYGALYGPGEPGGSINFITKRPQSDFAADLELGFGSYSEFITGIDVTGPLLPADELNYRLIARTEQADTFRDFMKHEHLFVNPMLAWQPTGALRIDASFEYVADDRLFDTGLPAIDGALRLPHDRFLGEPGSGGGRIDSHTFQVSGLLELARGWDLELSLNGQKAEIEGRSVEPDELITAGGRLLLNRAATRGGELSRAMIAQAELDGIVERHGIRHHLLFGTSATAYNEDTDFFASDPDDTPFAIDVYAPRYGVERPPPLPERDSTEQTRQFSIYAQDLLEIGERWRVLLGLRFDHIRQTGSDAVALSRFDRTSDEVSPRAGLVFRANPAVSLWLSYSESIDPNEGLRPDGSGLAPTESKAVETGIKWRPADLPVGADVSVFAIRQTNVTTDAPGNPGFELQSGEQESIGADFELRIDPTDFLSLTARYSFVDAQIKNDLVIRNGTTPLNVGKHQLSVLGLARASLFTRDDVSLSLSLNYTSERQGSLEPEELNLRLPDYFRGDVFVSWRQSDRLRFSLGIENFTDKRYVRGSQSDALHLMPGNPLTVRGQLKLSF